MADIINFNKNQQTSMEELDYIISMPDELFDTIFPAIKEETIKTFKNEQSSYEGIKLDEETRENLMQQIEKILKMIDSDEAKKELSKSKLEYLKLLMDCQKSILNNIPIRESVKVALEFCHPNAKEPTYANPEDAGCDVYAVQDEIVEAGKTKIIPTGLKVAIPFGWMISVRPRSGMSAKTGIRIANAPGAIDTGYRNEIGIILHNTSNEDYNIRVGDRIAQFVIEPAPMIKFEKVDSVESIGQNRGGGFGHSGT